MSWKAPAFQFYVMDWAMDLSSHPLEIEGAWIRIMCHLFRENNRGKKECSLIEWSRILRTDEINTERILRYLVTKNIANITFNNKLITVVSRRMMRDNKDRINNALRQTKYRESKKSNKEITEEAQNNNIASSSSSSSSSSKECVSEDTLVANDVFIALTLNTGKLYDIPKSDLEIYRKLYPAVDIEQELRNMKGWCYSNPEKRKTRTGIKAFITRWLSKEQNKGGNNINKKAILNNKTILDQTLEDIQKEYGEDDINSDNEVSL